jgi:peptidoglycan/LPS O-acetylase OafA/YrhL
MSVGHPERTTGVREQSAAASEQPTTTPSDTDRSGAAAPVTGSPGPVLGGNRVRQIDALRVLSCLSVVTVHAVGSPFPPDSAGLGETSFLLHYSREIFFFVSALVLVRTYYPRLGAGGRLPDESGFRRRRLLLIGVPYLWWTTLYYAVSIFHDRNSQPFGETLADMPLRWLYLAATGNGSYHMYFLLVTLQYAVLFPLVLRLLARTRGRHRLVLGVSLVLQLATLSVYQWWYLPDDGWRGLLGDASLPAYQFWLVLGAVVGLHLERCHELAMRHRRWVLAAFPVAAAVLMWTFFAQLPTRGALGASSPLQPIMVLWSLASLGVLYLLAVRITEHGSPALRATFSYGAQLSFGVYLAHPMVLDVVLSVLRRAGLETPTVWVSLASLVLTVAGSVAVCAALHRTRFSLALMGRPRLDPQRSPRLRWPRPRRFGGATLVLTVSVFAVLLVSGDQSSPAESGTPSWEETVEASGPPQADDPDGGITVDCGSEFAAPRSCPLPSDPDPEHHAGAAGNSG